MQPPPKSDRNQSSWLAPSALTRARVVEQAGVIDRITRINALLSLLVLAACAFTGEVWAVVPLVVLLAAVGLVPIAVKRVSRPEYVDFGSGLAVFATMAFGAGMSGGSVSPIVFLLPIGIVINASRFVPRATALGGLVMGTVFLGTSLLADTGAVVDHPLRMGAILVGLASVTLAAIALSASEIGYRRAAILDPLTGLLNRQGLEERFEELRQRALLADAPISLVLFDLDHFKSVNDRYGHDIGDAVLKQVAYEVRKSLRKFELVYRIRGEEFLVILPGIAEREALITAEQLRSRIEQVRVRSNVGVTASFGVSGGDGATIEFDALYRHADEALYDAKRGGRDRVCIGRQFANV